MARFLWLSMLADARVLMAVVFFFTLLRESECETNCNKNQFKNISSLSIPSRLVPHHDALEDECHRPLLI